MLVCAFPLSFALPFGLHGRLGSVVTVGGNDRINVRRVFVGVLFLG